MAESPFSKPFYTDPPGTISSSVQDPAVLAAQTKSIQEAYAKAAAANEKNHLAADRRQSSQVVEQDMPTGYVFAKSRALPNGIINHGNGGGRVPIESLTQYGAFAVLGTSSQIAAGGTALEWIGGSGSVSAVSKRLGGALALGATGTGAPLVVGTVALLMPNSTSADNAFYTSAQYAELSRGNTRVRVAVKHLSDGSVSAYGFYTGNKPDWQSVPVIAAQARGEQLVADLGGGIEVIWTPAVDPNTELGIPALEGASLKPGVWVHPSAEQANKTLINPEHPPDYLDAIIWFPSQPNIAAIYLSVSLRNTRGVVTGIGEDVFGIWLAGAGVGLGSPIPTRIANQLRRCEFSSFDAFRRAFWMAVADDPELSQQFNSRNLCDMKKGLAPVAPKSEHVGKRISFELHHVVLVKEGGAIYDVDNLRAVTSKRHINIHRGIK